MTVNPADSPLMGGLFGTEAMRTLFSDRGRLQAMLDVEAALARVQADLGIIPADAASAIARAARVDNLDLPEIAASTVLVGYPVVALVKQLGRAAGVEAARYVHWGATTQDILDTALVLQIRAGLDQIDAALRDLARSLMHQAVTHRNTVMAGRTHLQHALPVTFGYKCAVWLAPLIDHRERLQALRRRTLRVQFGGAVGTLASLGHDGRRVTEALASDLGLACPDAPWHVARDGLAEVAGALGLLCGTLAKFATDIVLLMQTEVGEVFEPHQHGRGGSSTMPQKRNPIASEYVLAATRGVHALVPLLFGAMAQDQERSTGPWQSEQLALPQIFVLTSGALMHSTAIAAGLAVDSERMRRNLEATGGLILAEAAMMALAPTMGRGPAHDAVERACNAAIDGRRSLIDVLAEDARVSSLLDRVALERLLDPFAYIGESQTIVDRVVAKSQEVFGRG